MSNKFLTILAVCHRKLAVCHRKLTVFGNIFLVEIVGFLSMHFCYLFLFFLTFAPKILVKVNRVKATDYCILFLLSAPENCTDIRHPKLQKMLFRNKQWQVHLWNNTNQMFLYSAYIDDRVNGQSPVNLIRIFLIFDAYHVSYIRHLYLASSTVLPSRLCKLMLIFFSCLTTFVTFKNINI